MSGLRSAFDSIVCDEEEAETILHCHVILNDYAWGKIASDSVPGIVRLIARAVEKAGVVAFSNDHNVHLGLCAWISLRYSFIDGCSLVIQHVQVFTFTDSVSVK